MLKGSVDNLKGLLAKAVAREHAKSARKPAKLNQASSASMSALFLAVGSGVTHGSVKLKACQAYCDVLEHQPSCHNALKDATRAFLLTKCGRGDTFKTTQQSVLQFIYVDLQSRINKCLKKCSTRPEEYTCGLNKAGDSISQNGKCFMRTYKVQQEIRKGLPSGLEAIFSLWDQVGTCEAEGAELDKESPTKPHGGASAMRP